MVVDGRDVLTVEGTCGGCPGQSAWNKATEWVGWTIRIFDLLWSPYHRHQHLKTTVNEEPPYFPCVFDGHFLFMHAAPFLLKSLVSFDQRCVSDGRVGGTGQGSSQSGVPFSLCPLHTQLESQSPALGVSP